MANASHHWWWGSPYWLLKYNFDICLLYLSLLLNLFTNCYVSFGEDSMNKLTVKALNYLKLTRPKIRIFTPVSYRTSTVRDNCPPPTTFFSWSFQARHWALLTVPSFDSFYSFNFFSPYLRNFYLSSFYKNIFIYSLLPFSFPPALIYDLPLFFKFFATLLPFL